MSNQPIAGIATRELLARAVRMTLPSVREAMATEIFNQEAGVLVVLNPAIPYEPKYAGGPKNSKFLAEVVYLVYPFGNVKEWEIDYLLVALSKAYGCWVHGVDSDQIGARLGVGMSPFPGGIVGNQGLIVAFSGVEGYFDRCIARQFDANACALVDHRLAELDEVKSPDRRSLPVPEADMTWGDFAYAFNIELELLFKKVNIAAADGSFLEREAARLASGT